MLTRRLHLVAYACDDLQCIWLPDQLYPPTERGAQVSFGAEALVYCRCLLAVLCSPQASSFSPFVLLLASSLLVSY